MNEPTRLMFTGLLICACSGTAGGEETPTSGSAAGAAQTAGMSGPAGLPSSPAVGSSPVSGPGIDGPTGSSASMSTPVEPANGAGLGIHPADPPPMSPSTTQADPPPSGTEAGEPAMPSAPSGPVSDPTSDESPPGEPPADVDAEMPDEDEGPAEAMPDEPPVVDGPNTGDPGQAGGPPQTSEACENGPLELPVDGCAPEFEESGDFYADCVARINQLRWECQCLPPLERWVEAEDCADAQAQYDYEVDRAHAGISEGICEPGGGSQNECPDYGPRFGIVDYCLQQMWDEGPGDDFQAHGHYINMSSTGVTKVACGRFETPEGNIWSVQNFSR